MKYLLLCLATASAAAAQDPIPRPALVIRDVTVLDTNAAKPVREHMDIRIVGRTIDGINATGKVSVKGDSFIDGRGLFAIPGLIDAHVHITGGPSERNIEGLRKALHGGVTDVFDLAGDARALKQLQADQRAGKLVGPRIVYAALFGGPRFFKDARAIEASRGYQPGNAPHMRAVTAKTDMEAALRDAKATGARGLKLYADIDSTVAAAATIAAHDAGMLVIAHGATFPGRPLDVVLAGADIITHTPYLVWEGVERNEDFNLRGRGDFRRVPAASKAIDSLLTWMVERRTALNPTLLVFADQPDSIGRTDWSNEVTRRANKRGVRIVAGTDGMWDIKRDSMPGIHRELELLVTAAGLSPYEALRAATLNSAWAVGDTLGGALLPGRNADIVLLSANPLDNIRNTRSIRYVMQMGRIVRKP